MMRKRNQFKVWNIVNVSTTHRASILLMSKMTSDTRTIRKYLNMVKILTIPVDDGDGSDSDSNKQLASKLISRLCSACIVSSSTVPPA